MAHDVFISYATENKPIADAICAKLEANNIRCWIAPRDILPAEHFAKAIYDAIDSSRLFVLVFSKDANTSPHVISEVQRAFNDSLTILPFRIDNIEPTTELQYFIGAPHWLDALTPPIEKHIDNLIGRVKTILKIPEDEPKEESKTPDVPRKDELIIKSEKPAIFEKLIFWFHEKDYRMGVLLGISFFLWLYFNGYWISMGAQPPLILGLIVFFLFLFTIILGIYYAYFLIFRRKK